MLSKIKSLFKETKCEFRMPKQPSTQVNAGSSFLLLMNLMINQNKAKSNIMDSNHSSDSTGEAGAYSKSNDGGTYQFSSIFDSLANGSNINGLKPSKPTTNAPFLRNTTTGIMEISKAVVNSI